MIIETRAYDECDNEVIMVEDKINTKTTTQVGPAADGYELTVGGFNDALSTLGDAMYRNNGMKFTTK